MSSSALQLTELPTETVEHVLLYLPGQDIIKMETVNQRFRDLIRNSPTLQHRCKLFAAGLIENPYNSCDLAQRRKQCEGHTHKWSGEAIAVKSTHKLPFGVPRGRGYAKFVGENVLALTSVDNSMSFLRISPVANRNKVGWWSIPPLPLKISCIGVYPPENILAVAEHNDRVLRVHLLDLRDGSPSCAPPSNTMAWSAPKNASSMLLGNLAITRSRIMISCADSLGNRIRATLLVWDLKTRELVFHLSTVNRNPSFDFLQCAFLDEFRILISTHDADTGALKFDVLNTLLPQSHPRSSLRFSLPSRFHDAKARVYVDQDRPLGTISRGTPLITDPSQAILVAEVIIPPRQYVWLIVWVQALTEDIYSTRADGHISWDEWGRSAVIMEVPLCPGPSICVHGTHVVGLTTQARYAPPDQPRNRIFDFSRHACSALPLWDEEGGVGEREALFKDGREHVFEENAGFPSEGDMQSLGDGRFFRLHLHASGSGATLHIWELP